ncbi:lachesin-like [Athalia rosae]|uniref:lachesin-like n=1 Tax=Athalia rosae TaxID=37344 RepID=UPI002033DEB1|nr:lachesin-like [Athalia rosae]
MAPSEIIRAILLAAFLHTAFGQLMPMVEIQPEFLAPLENHTVTQGRDVSFTCVVNHLQSYKVAWIKSDSRAILAIHTHMVAHNPRLSVTHNGHNTWKLHVANVQRNDSGTYMCQVNTDPMRSQMGYMEVVIPPDIMDLDDSTEGLTTKEGGSVRLRCRATGTPMPDVTWRREDGRNIVLRNEHGVRRVVKTSDGEQLYLVGVLRQEMGSYLCIASNGVPPSVSKRYSVRVHFQPLIKVANQLVAAPANSDVVIQCYAEASPRALNSWYKDTGEKLLAGDKYDMSEVPISEYAYQLNMTIRRLEKSDFGSYSCSSENAFGKAEGAVRLQELHLTKTTLPSIRHNDLSSKSRKKSPKERMNKKLFHGTESDERDDSPLPGIRSEESMPLTTASSVKSARDGDIRGVPRPPVGPGPPPAPAPAPAHSPPTELVLLNHGVASPRRCQFETLTITVIAVTLISRVC